jgi:putative hydrolase of the HAD superfamily
VTRTSPRRVDRRTPVLLIDAGGVLLLNNHSLLLPLVSRFGGVTTPEEYQRAGYACQNAAFPGDGGTGDYHGMFAEFAGVPQDRREEFTEEFRALSRTRNMCHLGNPPAVAMLRRVAAEEIPVVVVSQADGTAARLLREAEVCQVGPGPGVPVEAVVDSEIVGLDKPDPALFRHALDLVGAAPAQAAHLGDTVPADVRGAQAAGIRALHYDPYGDCRDTPGDHRHVRRLEETVDVLHAIAAEL